MSMRPSARAAIRAPCSPGRGRVFAFDRDPDAHRRRARIDEPRLILIEGRFSAMDAAPGRRATCRVDGVTMDIGVSSMQLDQAERGFSFQADGPLDMRMSRDGPTAADFVNTADEAEIADVLFRLGEEPQGAPRRPRDRHDRPITRTGELADRRAQRCGPQPHDEQGPGDADLPGDPHPRQRRARRTRCRPAAAERLLRAGGRLAVVSFHSLEDRMVKTFLRDRSGRARRPDRGTCR